MSFALLLGVVMTAAAPPRAEDLAAYEAVRAKVGRDADAHVKLALWCEAHGLAAERIRHLAIAVMTDPANATARGLMGLVAFGGRWQRPEEVSRKVQSDEVLTAALAEYNGRRGRTPQTADAQWKLAVWCEEKGLQGEAIAHFAAVVRLDPQREAAWKRLGYKKHNGRWVTEAQIAEAKAEKQRQEHADRRWKASLERWRGWLEDKARRPKAEEALAGVTDPRAVPMVWVVFASRDARLQAVAVRVLGQIDAPNSSQALALLAVAGKSSEVRRAATESLQRRDPRDFAGLLIGMLRKPIKYQVKPVGGPGSPGVLFVEGERFNVQRRYTPQPLNLSLLPGDRVDYDENGLPVVLRSLGVVGINSLGVVGINKQNQIIIRFDSQIRTLESLKTFLDHSLAPGQAGEANAGLGALEANATAEKVMTSSSLSHLLPGSRLEQSIRGTAVIPVGEMMLDAQKTAMLAERQLEDDVASIVAQNRAIVEGNSRSLAVLAPLSGQDFGADPDSWMKWLTDLKGYALTSDPTPDFKPTVVEDVPVAKIPPPPVGIITTPGEIQVRHSCFGGRTLVHTLAGPRKIETLRVGDRVLAQDTSSGALSFQPILSVYHNPPNRTLRIQLDGESVVATGIHRFWKAGRGWVMARDLKPGDTVRTVGGLAEVKAVDDDRDQKVYNLQVAEGQSFFVGRSGVLVHDNSLVRPVPDPFDATPDLADAAHPATTSR